MPEPLEEHEYECLVSFTYNAPSAVEAGKQFVDNLAMHPGWNVDVRNVETGRRYLVDGETGDIERQDSIPSWMLKLSQSHRGPEAAETGADLGEDLVGRQFKDPADSGQTLIEVLGVDELCPGYLVVGPADLAERTRGWSRPSAIVRPLCILYAMAGVVRDFMTDATDRGEHLDTCNGGWLDDYAAVAASVDIFASWVEEDKLHWNELEEPGSSKEE